MRTRGWTYGLLATIILAACGGGPPAQDTLKNFFEPRLLAFLAIMTGFWLMMYQLWDLQPNFIADWVDSRPMARMLGWAPDLIQRALIEQTPRGPMVPQQVLMIPNYAMMRQVGWLDTYLPPGTRLQVGNAIVEVTATPHAGCARRQSST